MSIGTSIAGRKHKDGIDFYQTPQWAIEALLDVEKFEGSVYECCSGAGAISKVLEDQGYSVISSDIREDDNVYGTKGVNMLELEDEVVANNIVTNPPFFCAQQVIEKSLKLTDKKVVMLLKLTFLESERRKEFFENTPLSRVYVFRKRVTMYPEGTEKPKNSSTVTYAWFIWEHGYKGEPVIRWI